MTSAVRFGPVWCQTRASMTKIEPAGHSIATVPSPSIVGVGPWSRRCERGTKRVPPFASVKSSSAQATFVAIGYGGHGAGT